MSLDLIQYTRGKVVLFRLAEHSCIQGGCLSHVIGYLHPFGMGNRTHDLPCLQKSTHRLLALGLKKDFFPY